MRQPKWSGSSSTRAACVEPWRGTEATNGLRPAPAAAGHLNADAVEIRDEPAAHNERAGAVGGPANECVAVVAHLPGDRLAVVLKLTGAAHPRRAERWCSSVGYPDDPGSGRAEIRRPHTVSTALSNDSSHGVHRCGTISNLSSGSSTTLCCTTTDSNSRTRASNRSTNASNDSTHRNRPDHDPSIGRKNAAAINQLISRMENRW
jgi:hypothetical protein